jgi:tetratricopeptide (TPR) repeat protein
MATLKDDTIRQYQKTLDFAARLNVENPAELESMGPQLADFASSFADFGLVAQLNIATEALQNFFAKLGRVKMEQYPTWMLTLLCYSAHAASALRYKMELQTQIFHFCKKHALESLQAHGWSGLGFLHVLQGNLEDSRSHFQAAEVLFERAGQKSNSLKVAVRIAMVQRFLQTDADPLLIRIKNESEKLGGMGFAPFVSASSTLGADKVARKDTAAGFRELREVVKLCAAVPKCQSTLYAMSQYGNALLQGGRLGEAVQWLEKVEQLQRTLEPAAQLTTQVVLLDAYLQMRRFQDALRISKRVEAHKLRGVDPDLADEADGLLQSLKRSLGDDRTHWVEVSPPRERPEWVVCVCGEFQELLVRQGLFVIVTSLGKNKVLAQMVRLFLQLLMAQKNNQHEIVSPSLIAQATGCEERASYRCFDALWESGLLQGAFEAPQNKKKAVKQGARWIENAIVLERGAFL